MALSKQYRLIDAANYYKGWQNGACSWQQIEVASTTQVEDFCIRLRGNYVGFQEHDPNTTTGSAEQMNMHYHIDSMSNKTLWINNCTAKIHVELYEVVPRQTVPGSQLYTSPLALLGQAHSGELFDNEVYGGQTPTTISGADPQYTPFMSSKLCSLYKIINIRKFTVHAGGRWQVNVTSNNFDAKEYTDFSQAYGYPTYARKGKYKCVLMKTYGELGVVANSTASEQMIRTLPGDIIGRGYIQCLGRVGQDTRTIFQDIDIDNTVTVPSSAAAHYISETNETIASVNTFEPTNSS